MCSNGSGKNLLTMSHNGSATIIEEEEEVESSTPSKQVPVVPVSDNLVDLDKSTTSIPAQTKEENKTVSYLALTKHGKGKKEGTETKVDPSNDSNPVSKLSFFLIVFILSISGVNLKTVNLSLFPLAFKHTINHFHGKIALTIGTTRIKRDFVFFLFDSHTGELQKIFLICL